jgi:hypothetical protein
MTILGQIAMFIKYILEYIDRIVITFGINDGSNEKRK